MTKVLDLLYDQLGRSLSGRDFISIHDLNGEQFMRIMEVAQLLKTEQKTSVSHRVLEGKTLGMIFQKPSTRTRVSFEVAIWQLGGYGLFLNANDMQLRRGETVGDTARVLSRYLDGIMIRTYSHDDVMELARESSIPVINGLTDLLHPCQAMADILTGYEKFGELAGRKLAYLGDGNNVAHSLMFAGAKAGMDVTCACPEGYDPDPKILALAREDASQNGAAIKVVRDPKEAVAEADIIYTDVWASMGQEDEHARRVQDLKEYQVNAEIVNAANRDCIVMHCLPAHRGEEITDEVADGPHSALWDEAENRLHVQKAILALTMS